MNEKPEIKPKKKQHPNIKPKPEKPSIPRNVPPPSDDDDKTNIEIPPSRPNEIPLVEPSK